MRAVVDSLLRGPAPVLPESLDRVAERWAGAPPRLRWALTALLAVLLLAVAGHGAMRSPWGPPRDVLVAASTLHPGHVLGAGDLRVERRPAATLPAGSLARPDEAVGVTLALGVAAGGVLTAEHAATGGLAAELPATEVALAIDEVDTTGVTAGVLVDVVGSRPDGTSGLLARSARVLALGDGAVWLALPREQAGDVATAAAWGNVWLALVGAGAGQPDG